MSTQLTIDEFARRTGTTARTVRAYLERGLLPPPRMIGRTGYYDASHVRRMSAIQRLQQEGFSLAGIRALLEAWGSGGTLAEIVGAEDALGAARTGAIDASELFPLTKFQRPADRAGHVLRQRCLARTTVAADRHVLMVAPGGSGKSTLAAQLSTAASGPSGWVSVEPRDDAPGQFWTAVLIGLRTAVPGLGDNLLAEIVIGGDVDRFLAALAEEVSEKQVGVTLVLDDLHEISRTETLNELAWFLDNVRPRDCRVVLCSRSVPAIGVSRLVASGRLIDLDTDELNFDREEARLLLVEQSGIHLSNVQVAQIGARTRWWAAGLYTAQLSLRTGTPPERLIASLPGSELRVQGHFAQELLGIVDPAHLDFLEDVSILDRFTADLCDAVRDRSDSETILAELQDNMFIVRLDAIGHWQRLHHSLATVLRARAGTSDQPRTRHRRAGYWFERHRHFPEAISHFVLAEAFDDAVRVLGVVYPRFLNISHQGDAVARWLAMLPDSLVAGSATLCLASAGVAGLRGERERMELWLSGVKLLGAGTDSSDLTSVQSTVDFMWGCFHFGEVERALRAAMSGYAACPRNHPWFPMQGASVALLRCAVEGPTDEVLLLAEEVLAHPAITDQPIALVGMWALKGVVLAARGDPAAGAAVHHATLIREQCRIDRVAQAAHTWSSTARAHRLMGDVDAAAADAFTAYDQVSALTPERDATGAVTPALIELVHARRLQGREAEAREYLAIARRRLAAVTGPGLLPSLLDEAAGGL